MNDLNKGSLLTAGMTLIGFGTNLVMAQPQIWQGYAVIGAGCILLILRERLKIPIEPVDKK